MRTEKEIMEKYAELINLYPNDMDIVQDRIVCYMEDIEYKIPENDNTIKEVPLEELNNYSYDIDLYIELKLFRRAIHDILFNLREPIKYVIYHRFYLEEDYSKIKKLTSLSKGTISEMESYLIRSISRIPISKQLSKYLKSNNFVDMLKDYKDLFWYNVDVIDDVSIIRNIINNKNKIITMRKNMEINKNKKDLLKAGLMYTNPIPKIFYQPDYYDMANYLLTDKSISCIMDEKPGYYIEKIIKHFRCYVKSNSDSYNLFDIAVRDSGIDQIKYYQIYVENNMHDKTRELSVFLLCQDAFDKKNVILLDKTIHELEKFLETYYARNCYKCQLSDMKINYFYKKHKLCVQLKDNFMPDIVTKNSKLGYNSTRTSFNQALLNSSIDDYLKFLKRYTPKNIYNNSNLYRHISSIRKILDICPNFTIFLQARRGSYLSDYIYNSETDKTIYDNLKEIFVDKRKRSRRRSMHNKSNIRPKIPVNLYRQKMFKGLKSGNIKPKPGNIKGALCYLINTDNFICAESGVFPDNKYSLRFDSKYERDATNCDIWINNNPKEASKIIKALFVSGVIDVDNKQIHTNISMSKISMHMVFYTIKEFLEETEKKHGCKWRYSRMGGIAYIYVTMLDALYFLNVHLKYKLVD